MTKPVRGIRKKKDDKAALLDIVTKAIASNREAVEEQLSAAAKENAPKLLKDLAYLFKAESEQKGGHDKAIVRIEYHPAGKGGK